MPATTTLTIVTDPPAGDTEDALDRALTDYLRIVKTLHDARLTQVAARTEVARARAWALLKPGPASRGPVIAAIAADLKATERVFALAESAALALAQAEALAER